jgi:hypothetical protein
VLQRGGYLVPHSWHSRAIMAGNRLSRQQNMGFSRSVSQHGSGLVVGAAVVGAAVGAAVGETGVGATVGTVGAAVGAAVQAVPSAVPPMPSVYDVPMVPTLTRHPFSPALLNTLLRNRIASAPAQKKMSRHQQDGGGSHRSTHNSADIVVIRPHSVGMLPLSPLLCSVLHRIAPAQ